MILDPGGNDTRGGSQTAASLKRMPESNESAVVLAETGIGPIAAMLPEFDLAGTVLVPALRRASSFRGLFGYFTSGVLAELAPGLADYLNRQTDPIQLVISPFITDDDIAAIEQGTLDAGELVQQKMRELLVDVAISESALATHTLTCLAWLLANDRLEIRVAYSAKRYHPKVWLLSDSSGTVCARGSANATGSAIGGNVENIDVDCTWVPGSSKKVTTFTDEFEREWNDDSDHVRVYPLDQAVANEWIETYGGSTPPTPTEYRIALEHDHQPTRGTENRARGLPSIKLTEFGLPPGLRWKEGPYKHQGEAVKAFEDNGRSGVLEMATGSGKTITALIAAYRTYTDSGKLLIIIAAPTKPLVSQWVLEARDFGLDPIQPAAASTRQKKFEEVDAALRRMKFGQTAVECLVVTNQLLTDPVFREKLQSSSIPRFLIGDEAHNLGSASFTKNPPDFFEYRLGLSATPIRQYDDEGTAELFNFFGGVVYRFGLDRAIGICLVPYDYFVHETALDSVELEEWFELSTRIRSNQWRDDDDEHLQNLYRMRRALVENAASKVPALEALLAKEHSDNVSHTLIYASSKNPRQLEMVRETLRRVGLKFHQVTELESADKARLRDIFLQFQVGNLQILVAKRILDEGVNVPEIRTAYILASTTVEREWVQRRGRVLRRAPGKDHAEIHDFVVVPPADDRGDPNVRSLLRGELERISAFGNLARNHADVDGAVAVASSLTSRFFVEGGLQ